MFRFLFGRPRTIRVPIDRSGVEIQQVKVTKQNRPRVSRFILTCVLTSVLIQGIKRWDPLGTYAQRDVLQEELERVKQDAQKESSEKYGKHWDKQHALLKGSRVVGISSNPNTVDAFRITVPIWLRKGHQRMYMSTDPEWREFAKLQGDSKRIEMIKRQIGESVMHQVQHQGRNKFELAVIKFNGRVGVALEVVPQIFTPPIYEVPCLWLSTKSISAGWRPLPPQTGARMERVFRPVVLLEASTAAVQMFFTITYLVTKAKLLQALGTESKGSKSTIYVPQLPPQPPKTEGVGSAYDARSKKPVFPLFPDLGNGDAMRKMHADVVSSMPYSSAIQHAALAFNHVRDSRQRLAVSTNVRGIFQIRGYITFIGERGKFRLEVIAYYLPADDVFVGAVNVKSGFVVQDYRAWDKLIDKAKQNRQASTEGRGIRTSSESKPGEPPSPPTTDESKEQNK